MCKHWGLHISTNINHLSAILGSFWAVWGGLLWCLKAKLRSWRFPRYWQFNKQYHSGYQLICLIYQPLLITSRRDWYQSKGLFKGFPLPLRPWELMENWWRYSRMKFVTMSHLHAYVAKPLSRQETTSSITMKDTNSCGTPNKTFSRTFLHSSTSTQVCSAFKKALHNSLYLLSILYIVLHLPLFPPSSFFLSPLLT